MSSTSQFRLSIGAKRQITLPKGLMEELNVPDNGELLIEVIGDHAVITPMVSVPRAELPEELRRTFESRRGAQPSDIPVAQFLQEIGYKGTAPKASVAPRSLSVRERLANLTPNERKALQQSREELIQQRSQRSSTTPTERQREVLELLASGRSSKQIAQRLGLAEHTVKTMERNLSKNFKLAKLRQAAQKEARS